MEGEGVELAETKKLFVSRVATRQPTSRFAAWKYERSDDGVTPTHAMVFYCSNDIIVTGQTDNAIN